MYADRQPRQIVYYSCKTFSPTIYPLTTIHKLHTDGQLTDTHVVQ